MGKNNIIISEKVNAALKRRTAAEEKLLKLFGECETELFNEFVDAWTEYEDCLLTDNM